MFWSLSLFLSASVIGVVLTVALIFHFIKKNRKVTLKTAALVYAGFFFSTFILFLPIDYALAGDETLEILKTILYSLNHTLRSFTMQDISFIRTSIKDTLPIYQAYVTYMTVICFICPFLSLGYILSFFKNIRARTKFWLSFCKDLYVFSELNENTLVLAEDLKKNHPSARIIFTGVSEQKERNVERWSDRLDLLNCVCFKRSVTAEKLRFHSPKTKIMIFAFSSDENKNLQDAVKLIERFRTRENTSLYLLSTGTLSEMTLTDIDKGKVFVKRIDRSLTLVDSLLFEKGTEIFDTASGEDGRKVISAVIVGLGRIGSEMLKALSWYGQMDGYRLVIHGFDADPSVTERLRFDCPELFDDAFNGKAVPGQAEYEIHIHAGVSADTGIFADEIKAIRDASYVFVSAGEDKTDVVIAANLRMLFERMGIHPLIQAVVEDFDVAKNLNQAGNFKGQKYDIDFVGGRSEVFSEIGILFSETEREALESHKRWGNEEDFWRYEYNYRSSLAQIIHVKARRYLGLQPLSGKDLNQEEKDRIALLEHKRWTAYMRSVGYVFSGSADPSSRNDLAKMHHDLVPFEQLSCAEQQKDLHSLAEE